MSKKHKLFDWRQKWPANKVLALSALSLLVFSTSFIALFPNKTYAATAYSPTQIAKAYQSGKALMECSTEDGFDIDRSASELNSGALFRNGGVSGINDSTNTVGYVLLPDSDGLFSCVNKSHVTKAIKAVEGGSGKDFALDAKIYKAKSGGDGFTVYDRDNNVIKNNIKKYVEDKFKIDLDSRYMPKASQYFALKATFLKACSDGKDDDNGIDVVIVDEATGKKTTEKYMVVRNDVSFRVGFGLEKDGGNDGKMECDTIVSQMKVLAADAEKAQGDAIDNGADVSTDVPGTVDGNTGENSNATCESSGLNLSWIICPVFNGIAEVTEWFYFQIISPFLYSPPVDTDPSSNSYKAWSSFRLYGNVFIIIALLVVVFGQSIGGGLIDAYTAKKIVPRIVAAAILINISIYIVALMIDLSNIAGRGISAILLAPFGDLTFGPSNGAGAGAVGLAMFSAIAGAGGLVGFVGALLTGGAGPVIIMVMFTVIVPAVIAIIGVFATLIIRRGILLALILVSPVAFALYCLPNTEKYFKKWWELLFKTLLVYPIIMMIFAISNILSLTIVENNDGVITEGIAGIVAFAAQIIPLFMIPFAFKIAGGAMGQLYAAIQNGGQKAGGLLKSRQEQSKIRARNQMLQSRERVYDKLGARGDKSGRTGRSAYRFLQSRVGGQDLYAGTSAMTAERFKEMEAIKATGRDDELRALNVNKSWALENDATGGTHWRQTKDGRREFRTLAGKWVSENAVDAAQQRWGGDQAAMQWSLGYEMSKAATQEENDYLFNSYGRLGDKGSGLQLSSGQLGGMWTGAAFGAQNTDRQWKHYGWDGDSESLKMSPVQMMREIDERQGSYQMSMQSADTWTTMTDEINRARRIVSNDPTLTDAERGGLSMEDAQETLQRGARIARSIGQSVPLMKPDGTPQLDSNNQPIYQTSVGSGASGRTKEEMEAYYALFADSSGNIVDYEREYGVERRMGAGDIGPADQVPRSGQGQSDPQGPLRGNSPMGPRQEAVRNDHRVDQDIDNQRNSPKGT